MALLNFGDWTVFPRVRQPWTGAGRLCPGRQINGIHPDQIRQIEYQEQDYQTNGTEIVSLPDH
ncbi:hypothetical protein ACTXT7_007506 [Hymenolepis weldensis]